MDQLEYLYKESLPEASYGVWNDKCIELDDHLELQEADTIRDYAETC